MMSQKICNIKKYDKGMLILDAILATALAGIFIGLFVIGIDEYRDMFWRFKARDEKLSQIMGDISTGNISTSSQNISLFGNEMIEGDYSGFKTRSKNREVGLGDYATRPYCSVSFADGISFTQNAPTDQNINIRAISLPVNPLLPLTHMEIRGDRIYVSADSNTASDPDLLIFNLASNATFVSSINTGPGLASFILKGDLVYGIARSSQAQLHVINIKDKDPPILISKIRLPPASPPYSTSTLPYASAVSVFGDYLYLGTEKWDGDELSAWRIYSSDSSSSQSVPSPSAPQFLGSLKVGGKINDIFATKNRIFVATANSKQLLNVHVYPDSPDPSGVLILENNGVFLGANRQEGTSLDLFENALFFGRTTGGYDISSEHEIFDMATTSLDILRSSNVFGGVYGMIARKKYIFAISKEINKEFKIFERMQDDVTNTPKLVYSLSLPIIPQSITCEGDKLFVLSHSSPTIYGISFK